VIFHGCELGERGWSNGQQKRLEVAGGFGKLRFLMARRAKAFLVYDRNGISPLDFPRRPGRPLIGGALHRIVD